jgi:CheY-like chemotaxis protein
MINHAPPINVLLAEHDRWKRHVVASMLTEAGFAVHQATNGMAAVRAAAEIQPHLVLLGPSLPEIDAAAVRQVVCSDPRTRHTAVVELESPRSPIELLGMVVNALDERHQGRAQAQIDEAAPMRSVMASACGVWPLLEGMGSSRSTSRIRNAGRSGK